MGADDHLQKLGSLIDLLRSKGVRVYRESETTADGEALANVEIELEPTVVEHRAEKQQPEPDPDICSCGHFAHEHQDGLCLRGCDAEACAPREKT